MTGIIHRRLAALEARGKLASSYVVWLSAEEQADPAAVEAAIVDHARRTGWAGPVIVAPPEVTVEEWVASTVKLLAFTQVGFPPGSGGFCKEPEHPRRAPWQRSEPDGASRGSSRRRCVSAPNRDPTCSPILATKSALCGRFREGARFGAYSQRWRRAMGGRRIAGGNLQAERRRPAALLRRPAHPSRRWLAQQPHRRAHALVLGHSGKQLIGQR